MRTTRRSQYGARCLGLLTATIFGATTLVAYSPTARADEVSPKGKGIVGGALLGAEVVTIGEALGNVRPTWAYWVGGLAGAAGGGVAGYFVEQSSDDGKAPVFMLAGGLALALPAMILTLNQTRYHPGDEGGPSGIQDTSGAKADPGSTARDAVGAPSSGEYTPPGAPAPVPATTPSPNPATPPAGTQPPASTPPAPAPNVPTSLFDVNDGALRFGVPVVEVRPMYSLREIKQFGMQQQTEVRMPVLHVTF